MKPFGPDAFLVEFASSPGDDARARGAAIRAFLSSTPPAGLTGFAVSFTTALLELESAADAPAIEKTLLSLAPLPDTPGDPVVIDVRYDGPDLARVAEHARLAIEEVIRRHTAPVYRVHALGFAPGFAYLGGLDTSLETPRLPAPRASVPAGSVGIGGAQTGVYPIDGPGGWNLIGRTDARLFDPATGDERAFLLHEGARVVFRAA